GADKLGAGAAAARRGHALATRGARRSGSVRGAWQAPGDKLGGLRGSRGRLGAKGGGARAAGGRGGGKSGPARGDAVAAAARAPTQQTRIRVQPFWGAGVAAEARRALESKGAINATGTSIVTSEHGGCCQRPRGLKRVRRAAMRGLRRAARACAPPGA
ncbi:MAG: hypothetical protein J3K34DRAFT_430298, partial [Monoraphidium minutum]